MSERLKPIIYSAATKEKALRNLTPQVLARSVEVKCDGCGVVLIAVKETLERHRQLARQVKTALRVLCIACLDRELADESKAIVAAEISPDTAAAVRRNEAEKN
jgi:hypothetical protein